MGLRFDASDDEIHQCYLKLDEASLAEDSGFDVYTHETMPSRYHFSQNTRIAPIYVVPHEGYALTDRVHDGSDHMNGVSTHCPVSSLNLFADTIDTVTRLRQPTHIHASYLFHPRALQQRCHRRTPNAHLAVRSSHGQLAPSMVHRYHQFRSAHHRRIHQRRALRTRYEDVGS